VQAPIVVINLDVFEDLPARFTLGGEELVDWKTLRFQRAEERFRLGVGVDPELRLRQRIQNSIFG